jgi:hypothetical protein
MSPDDIAIRYHPRRNPSGAALGGVPLRDLTRAEFQALPEWLRRAVVASPCYTIARRRVPSAGPSEIKKEPTDG